MVDSTIDSITFYFPTRAFDIEHTEEHEYDRTLHTLTAIAKHSDNLFIYENNELEMICNPPNITVYQGVSAESVSQNKYVTKIKVQTENKSKILQTAKSCGFIAS
ncbi:hypothetical protein [Wolbachia endosymbiont of Ctenocephalides felis wCfeT]|uniref:hypothetical protein n=1 Tax=Wolbachia endosymbiont of Ctenocephalides felis wCfeT TaxID=2732593 RepID=UPI00144546A8|nr:hypothetical protein [Wolbachia endosymbiont of Ctenocephalides felis wCfeT]